MSTIVENHKLRSCLWFVSLLKEHRELTFDQIDQYWQQETALSDGAPLPKRTFHDRLNSIQDILGVIISCNRRNGYRWYIETMDDDKAHLTDWLISSFSIGQLIMALCLQRAAQLENGYFDADNNYVQGIVGCRKGDRYYNGLMDDIEDSSQQLEIMTKIESEVLESSVNMSSTYVTYKGASYSYYAFLTEIAGMEEVPSGTADASSTDFLAGLESAMDSKNSFSQQTMIKLQSLTNKRDQAYDLISNALKSINTVLTGNVNNM